MNEDHTATGAGNSRRKVIGISGDGRVSDFLCRFAWVPILLSLIAILVLHILHYLGPHISMVLLLLTNVFLVTYMVMRWRWCQLDFWEFSYLLGMTLEDVIHRKEQELNEAQRIAHVGSWYWDATTEITTGSDEFLRIFGLVSPTQKDMRFYSQKGIRYPEASWQMINDAAQKALQSGVGYDLQVQGIRANGDLFWMTAKGEAVRNAGGRITGLRGTVQDITERLQKEQAIASVTERLAQRVAELDSIISAIPDAVTIYDKEGRIIRSNALGERFLGYNESEKATPFADRTSFNRAFDAQGNPVPHENLPPRRALRGETISVERMGVIQKEGSLRWVSCSAAPIYKDKDIVGAIVIVRDITDTKRAEQALCESEERFKIMAEVTPVGMGVTSRSDATFLYVNPAYEKHFGYLPGELMGKPVPNIYWDLADRDRILELLRQQGTVSEYEVRLKRKDGTSFWGLSSIRPIIFDGKNAFLGVFADISERKKAEEILTQDKEAVERLVNERTLELVNTQMELERSKRLSDIGMLAATVAHELRNPLGVINTAAYNLKRKTQNIGVDSHIRTIEKKVQEGNSIITNLLFYSKIKSPQYEDVNLADNIRECIETAVFHHQKKSVAVESRLEPIAGRIIKADSFQMTELFNNILNNAFDAVSETGGGGCRQCGCGWRVCRRYRGG